MAARLVRYRPGRADQLADGSLPADRRPTRRRHRAARSGSNPRLAEVDYGDWTGRALKDLAGEDLWRTVQAHPSAAVFPGGEGLAAVGVRAVRAIRGLTSELGPDAVILVCSHGDVIKSILADALGLHLDGFQRIMVAPASLSVVRYTPLRPFVERINDSGELGSLRPPPAACGRGQRQPRTRSLPAEPAARPGRHRAPERCRRTRCRAGSR